VKFPVETPKKKSRMQTIVICLAILGSAAIIALGLLLPAATSHNAAVGYAVGDAAPNFTLTTPDGRTISLSDYRGQPVMLNFWYATCPGCLQETPTLQQFYAQQRASGKRLVILGIDSVDDSATAARFVQQHHLTYPVLIDDKQQVMTLYNVAAAPTSFFIDSKGIIRAMILGPQTTASLQQHFANL
jgi:cytochrome c biogenesis protein CcmG/thiol:disulfide interchange protein DsbE